jgi:hypothetical protein
MNYIKLTLLVVVFVISGIAKSGIVYSTGDGDWTDPIWDPSAPGCGDTIIIQATHSVDITTQLDYQGCTELMAIVVDGTLNFPGNGPKLDLPCGSGVLITSNGLLTASGSSGSSNKITICGNGNANTVWDAGDGDQSDIGFGTTPTVTVITLAVTLDYFEGVYQDGRNKLRWKTFTEINNDYFEVLRTTDGINYQSIGIVDGAGNSYVGINYSLEDDHFERNTINYYRLKTVDFDGVVEYSDIISINNFENELPKLIGSYNLLGQPVTEKHTGIIIDLYDNGDVVKRYPIK